MAEDAEDPRFPGSISREIEQLLYETRQVREEQKSIREEMRSIKDTLARLENAILTDVLERIRKLEERALDGR